MNYRYITVFLFLLSIMLVGGAYLVWKAPQLLFICDVQPSITQAHCLSSEILGGVIFPLTNLSILPFLFLVLMFVRKEVFRAWAWFAVPFALVAFVFLASQPAISANMFGHDRFELARALSYIFTAISVLIVLVKYALIKRAGE